MSKSLNAALALVSADSAGSLYVLDIAIKDKELRLIEVYAFVSEDRPFLTTSR